MAIAQLLGGLDLPYAPFRLLYLNVFKANGWVKPNVITDNQNRTTSPCWSARCLTALLRWPCYQAQPSVGVLVGIVIVLANLSSMLRVKSGHPGFTQAPLE